mmetsp:Transcript_4815/g.14694  ORF Transcript_4815/g.14694 Transcript_4815/m.14694 type:complete len:542 (-) Transcript_4815:2025-3650(-)
MDHVRAFFTVSRLREWCLAGAVVSFMVLGTVLGRLLQVNYAYNNPFFITYLNTSFLVICFPLQWVLFRIRLAATPTSTAATTSLLSSPGDDECESTVALSSCSSSYSPSWSSPASTESVLIDEEPVPSSKRRCQVEKNPMQTHMVPPAKQAQEEQEDSNMAAHLEQVFVNEEATSLLGSSRRGDEAAAAAAAAPILNESQRVLLSSTITTIPSSPSSPAPEQSHSASSLSRTAQSLLRWPLFVQEVRTATKMPLRRLFLYSIPFSLCWMAANYVFVMGLPLTNVASSLTLEQCTTVWVFLLSVLFLRERVTVLKVLSVLICLSGVTMVAFGDQSGLSEGEAPLLGDALIVASTFASALYMCFYKLCLRHLGFPAVNVLLCFIGISAVLCTWPMILLLDLTQQEVFYLPGGIAAVVLVANAIDSLLFNWSLNYGIFSTTPLFMRIVVTASVPASFVVDYVVFGETSSALKIAGAVVILVGFFAFNFAAERAMDEANNSSHTDAAELVLDAEQSMDEADSSLSNINHERGLDAEDDDEVSAVG